MAAIVIRDTVHLRGRLIVASPSGENKFLHFLPIHNVLEMTIRYTAGVRMAEFTTSIWYTVYDNCFSLFATYCLKKNGLLIHKNMDGIRFMKIEHARFPL